MLYIFMLLFGSALLIYGIAAYWRGMARYRSAASSWRQGVATIDQSWLERMETSTSDGSTISYRARVAYRYLVDGIERSGTRPFLCARQFCERAERQEVVGQRPRGCRGAGLVRPCSDP